MVQPWNMVSKRINRIEDISISMKPGVVSIKVEGKKTAGRAKSESTDDPRPVKLDRTRLNETRRRRERRKRNAIRGGALVSHFWFVAFDLASFLKLTREGRFSFKDFFILKKSFISLFQLRQWNSHYSYNNKNNRGKVKSSLKYEITELTRGIS